MVDDAEIVASEVLMASTVPRRGWAAIREIIYPLPDAESRWTSRASSTRERTPSFA